MQPEEANSKKKILIVDDDPDLASVVRIRLEATGYHVLVLHSPTECLARLDEIKPHLLIIDVDMPEKNGLALFLELKRRLTGEPVIISSGVRSEGVINLFKGEGAFAYLVKPVESRLLTDTVRQALSRF
ncbi:MAG: response regulator [Candidatus Omnitrophica bacterium]|nr:response regulator [Candidatus Omnitrophota bacterium]